MVIRENIKKKKEKGSLSEVYGKEGCHRVLRRKEQGERREMWGNRKDYQQGEIDVSSER